MKLKEKIIYINLIVVVIFILVIGFNNKNSAKADTIDFGINSVELYSATNTYNYNDQLDLSGNLIPGEENNRRYIMNSAEDNNGNIVSNKDPMLTILTHSLGGGTSDWSNVGDDGSGTEGFFGYTPDSILTRLCKICPSNVYVAEITSNSGYRLYDITKMVYNEIDSDVNNDLEENDVESETKDKFILYNYTSNEEISSIKDISKHSIVLFQGKETDKQNHIIYTEFNYAISRIIYDIKLLNNNELPKINLIGYSRGGLTNLEFALDHPKLVDSIYSLGTPYCGSTSAEIDYYFLDCEIGKCPEGELDIITKSKYLNYLNRWNNNYEELGYDKINVHALGGYSSLDFFQKMVWTEQGKKGLSSIISKYQIDMSTEISAALISSAFAGIELSVLNSYFDFENLEIDKKRILIRMKIAEVLSDFNFSGTAIDEIVEVLVSEMNLDSHFPFVSLYNDGFVDLSSQLGYYGGGTIPVSGYKGFNRKKFCFTSFNSNTNGFAKDALPIVHNIEIRDTRMINYILKDIKLFNSHMYDYETYDISDEEIGIKLYLGSTDSDILLIPNHINGKKVTEIGSFAFAGAFDESSSVTEVQIPNTIIKIKESAFEECTNIEKIVFSDSIESIGDNCFAGCTGFGEDFILPNNLKNIGKNVFLGTNISNLLIDENSEYFSIENKTLFDKEKTEIIISFVEGEYVVPETVTKIRDYAFYENVNIESINLSNIKHIGDHAFLNCVKLNLVKGGDEVNSVGSNAFYETNWLNNNDEILILGSVLLQYRNETESRYVIPSCVASISNYAFCSNNLKEVIIPSEVDNIGSFAFTECPNLVKMYILDYIPPFINSSSFPIKDNLVIYVPGLYIDNYKNNSSYVNYVTNISEKWVTVDLLDGDMLYKTVTLKYYSILEGIDNPKYVGKDFKGWKFGTREKYYNNGSIFDIYEDNIDLEAVYEDSQYELYLNYNIGEEKFESIDVTYGEILVYPIPIKEGYTFIGWFDVENKQYSDENGKALFGWDKTDKTVLYALFEEQQFSIIYNLDGGTNSINNPETFYSDEVIILENPTKYGYIFQSWEINGERTDSIKEGTYTNIEAVATWIGDEIDIGSTCTSYTTTNLCEIINLNNSSQNYIFFTISSKTQKVTFINKVSRNVHNACINVEERDVALIINLKNVNLISPYGYHTINASKGEYTLYLNCSGNNFLTGGSGINSDNYLNKNGCYGISAYKLVISGGSLTIKGGDGYSGQNGTFGTNGIDGIDNPNGNILNPEEGENGTNGQAGSDGESGGNGGFAIYTISTFAYINCKMTITGGNGGSGGNGGDGGNGGNGASDTSASILDGVGTPGNGGDGGDGGDGGNAGIGSPATNSNISIGIKGEDGVPGKGGQGGLGGIGGDGGSLGENGKNGENGIVGEEAYILEKIFFKINCETNNEIVKVNAQNQNSAIVELTVECEGYYDINTISSYGSTLKLYNEFNEEILEFGSILINNNLDILIYPMLSCGKYYLKVVSNGANDSIDICFYSHYNENTNVLLNKKIDILSHHHNGIKTYTFYSTKNSLYYISLSLTSQYNREICEGAIKVLHNGQLIQKFESENYNNEAILIENSNILVFYGEKGKTYDIEVEFNDYSIDSLILKISDFQAIEIDNNVHYEAVELMTYGDSFKLWNVESSGKYIFKLEYNGGYDQNTIFYILKETEDNIYILNSAAFSGNDSMHELIINVEQDDKIYFGYLNGIKEGTLIISFDKYISKTFEILTDVNENVSVGSEVSVNEGSYGGRVITVGFTRICYLGNDAPDKTSRLKYEWKSSNEDIAIVSSYGTITAIRAGRVTITATYKDDETIVGVIIIEVVPNMSEELVLLKYGMDCRTGGTISGTEVTSGKGDIISVSKNPNVTIHVGYTRLICIGDDSPSSSVQDFIWETSDKTIASVSTYGTITAKKEGIVKITGTYKYNSNYIVEIEIEVLSN